MTELNSESTPQRIAVVGSGISGLTCAYLLSRQHQVSLFEANDYLGGHTHTVDISLDQQDYAVDTGFIVCNDRNYSNFLRLMQQLDIGIQDTEMSFSVSDVLTGLEYNGHNLNTLFAQRSNFFRPSFYCLLRDILRFNKEAKRLLAREEAIGEQTLDQMVAHLGLSERFRQHYLLPMVAAIWSCSAEQAGQFPLKFFLRFFNHHGLLELKNRPQWHVLQGGSRSYIKPMTQRFADNIYLNTPVIAIERNQHQILLHTGQGNQAFDHVIVACHSDQALALLKDASEQESEILAAIPYQENEVILHTDASLMPTNRRAWASWNVRVDENSYNRLAQVTYSMNILQGLQSSQPLLVSLNAGERIAPEKVLQRFCYAHPVFNQSTLQAQARRNEICGTTGVHFCGAYWYNGFHEDGVRSALDVCSRFGVSL